MRSSRTAPVAFLLLSASLLAACLPPRQRASKASPPPALAAPDGAPQAAASARSALKRAQVQLAALAGRRVVLVTHPMPRIVAALRQIVAEKALEVPDLAVVGLYHAGEEESYERAAASILEQPGPWAGLLELSCEVPRGAVYRQNGCSAAFRELVASSHAMIFTGGWDIPPGLYGQKTRLTTAVQTPQRHVWELSLLHHLLGGRRAAAADFRALLEDRPDYAVLGICLGMQSMNVATGGTLHQDILADLYKLTYYEEALELKPEQLHRNPAYAIDPASGAHVGLYHPVRFTAAPELWKELAPGDAPVSGMSIHHQALAAVGAGLEVIATSADGKVVEAVRHARFANVLGVQFHPEYHFLAVAPRGTRDAVVYAVPPQNDEATRAFHRRFWQRFGRVVRAVQAGGYRAPADQGAGSSRAPAIGEPSRRNTGYSSSGKLSFSRVPPA